jgi:hypothetical protein
MFNYLKSGQICGSSVLGVTYVFNFIHYFCSKYILPREIYKGYIYSRYKNALGLYEVPIIFCPILTKIEMQRKILVELLNIRFHKNLLSGSSGVLSMQVGGMGSFNMNSTEMQMHLIHIITNVDRDIQFMQYRIDNLMSGRGVFIVLLMWKFPSFIVS